MFSDGLVIWILAMLPLGAFFTLGGFAGVLAAAGLLVLLVPLRFWEGFRYQLVARQPNALPPARALGVSTTHSSDDREVVPHPEPPETS